MAEVLYVSFPRTSINNLENLFGEKHRKFFDICSWENVANVDIKNQNFIVVDLENIQIQAVKSYIKETKGINSKIKVLLLIQKENTEVVFELVEAGADSILQKDQVKELGFILRNLSNNYYLPTYTHQTFINKIQSIKNDNFDLFYQRLSQNGVSLSVKEALVAYYVKDGLKNLIIANEIGVSEGTVKIHVSKLYKKLHIKGRKKMIEFLNDVNSTIIMETVAD